MPRPVSESQPSEISQGDDDRHQRDHLLQDAEEPAERHEEEGHHQQQDVFSPTEAWHDPCDDIPQDTAAVHDGKGDPDQHDEDDDADDRGAARGGEDLEGGREPAPDGIIGALQGKGFGIDHLATLDLHPGVLPGRDQPGQDSGGQHQDEDDRQGLDECLGADLRARFFFHGGGLLRWQGCNSLDFSTTLLLGLYFECERAACRRRPPAGQRSGYC